MILSGLTENLEILSTNADPGTEITDICCDSRLVTDGAVFVAITGFESDGHRFIAQAADRGAAAVICERPDEAAAAGIPYVVVENSRLALALASAAFYGYPAREMTVIGVTGTSGKTTSTHLIKHILESVPGNKVGLVGTNGNMIGSEELHTERTTPESCELQKLFREMADKGCTHVVMEVSSHALTLDRVAGIGFSVAAYTNLSRDHLDLHGTMEAYADAKSLLFGMTENACINLDDGFSGVMIESAERHGCRLLTTSAESNDAGVTAKDIRMTASGVRFFAVYGNDIELVRVAIPGKFTVYNALTAISVCLSAGLGLSECASALATAPGVRGRMESVPTGSNYSVILDYSHKPDALEKVLDTLRPITSGRLIVLFGCGGDRDRTKRPIMGRVAGAKADIAVVTSDNPRTEEPEAIISEILAGMKESNARVVVINDRIEAIHWTLDNARSGDVILLAGKGHEDYQIIGHEKHHMDEREIVLDYLDEKRKA